MSAAAKTAEAAVTTMRAMVIPEAKGRFRLEERPLPEPRRREVRIRVHACGVCHSDAVLVEGQMPGLTYPRIPGHEVIGVVDALGADVQGWEPGTRVGVGWSPGFCGYCNRCRHGDSFACENLHGATGTGAMPPTCWRMSRRWSACRRRWTRWNPPRCSAPA